jgi:hypothetical protein
MTIAADTCIYTNHNFTIQSMVSKPPPKEGEEGEVEAGTGGADVAGSAADAKAAADAEAAAERAAAPSTP